MRSATIAGGVFRTRVNPTVTVVMSEIPGRAGFDQLTAASAGDAPSSDKWCK